MLGNNNIVVVLGMHRSGTSAITKSLEIFGVQLGDNLMEAVSGENDKGYWEDLDIYNFNKGLLKLINQKWDSFKLLESETIEYYKSLGLIDKAIELLNEKISTFGNFGFKDPRTAILIPFWMEVLNQGGFRFKFVIVFRNPLAVASSLFKRDDFSKEKSFILWLTHTINALYFVRNHDFHIISFEEIINNPKDELNRLNKWIGISYNAEKYAQYVDEFLEKNLNHYKFTLNDSIITNKLNVFIVEVYSNLLNFLGRKVKKQDLFKLISKWYGELLRMNFMLGLLDYQDQICAKYSSEKLTILKELENYKVDYKKLLHAYKNQYIEIENLKNSMCINYELIESQKNYIDSLKSSYSWKITEPIRSIFSFLKNLKFFS